MTVLICGQVVPAGGLVPVTVPTGASEPTCWVVATRCTRCSAACAAASVSFCTLGTTEVKSPLETRMVIAAPFGTRPAGRVPTTEPLATALLCTRLCLTMKPSAFRTAVARATRSRATEGTGTNRPEVSHQPPNPSPTPSAMITTTMSSRGLNSQRPRKDSRPPRSVASSVDDQRAPSSRSTTDRVGLPRVLAPARPAMELSHPARRARAHQPLVAAGVSRSSQGASASPWTPAPITPVSPLARARWNGRDPP